tara:strand:- start:880 stop:2175 length:1296 start_codon:yes stop_codon:yes gene_type:complete
MGDGNREEVKLSLLGPEDRFVLDRLRERGRAWIVGGWVRDLLAGHKPSDIDIATDLVPEDVGGIFPRSIMVGAKFGTCIVRIEKSESPHYQCEVTTLREDGGYADGRRPDNVVFGTEICDDLDRRDFTINAMAIEPIGTLSGNKNPVGELIDEGNRGITDLKNGIVRAVGDPEKRLGEDGLRVIRAFRFLSKADGGIRSLDPSLSDAIVSKKEMLGKVSKERILAELRAILAGQNSKKIVRMMDDHRLFEEITPGMSINNEVGHSHDYLVNLALIYSLERCSGAELSDVLGENLRLSNAEKSDLSFLHSHRKLDLDHSDSSVRRFMAALSESQKSRVVPYLSGRGIDTTQFEERCEVIGQSKSRGVPLIDGNMLSELTGLEPGKQLGRLKDWLHRIQVEGDIDSKESLIEKLDDIGWENSDFSDWPVLSWP